MKTYCKDWENDFKSLGGAGAPLLIFACDVITLKENGDIHIDDLASELPVLVTRPEENRDWNFLIQFADFELED